MHHLIFGFIRHNYIRNLKSQSCKQMSSVERIVLDFESEVMRSPGSIPPGVTFFLSFITQIYTTVADPGGGANS